MQIPCQRSRFSLPREITYFNCAYLSPLLDRVQEAGTRGLMAKSTPWAVKPHHFFEESDYLRSLIARILGGDAGGVAIIPSVSYGIGIAAANLPIPQGKKVLVLAEQFPSNVYPWHEATRRCGGEMVTVARPQDGDWTKAVLAGLTEDIAVAALPHCHWTDGSLLDLEVIGARCRSLAVPLVLDVTQSLGAMPFPLEKIKPAFVVAAGYKWLLGPYSMAYLYVAPEYRQGRPLEYNWISRKESHRFSRLVDYTEEMAPGAQRFDVGERSNFILVPMAIAALSTILEWTVPNIAATLSAYNEALIQGAERLGFQPIAKPFRSPHLLGLRYPGKLPENLGEQLAEKNIFVSIRGDAIRVSPHLYNDEQDTHEFLATLGHFL